MRGDLGIWGLGDLGNQLSPYFSYRQAVRPTEPIGSEPPSGVWRNAPSDVRRKGTRTKTGMPCLFPISLLPYLPIDPNKFRSPGF